VRRSRLLERGEEGLALRRRIDDVVVGAVQQQEAGAGALALVDGGIADRRGVEEGAAALHRG
jgi:hypothetical protein